VAALRVRSTGANAINTKNTRIDDLSVFEPNLSLEHIGYFSNEAHDVTVVARNARILVSPKLHILSESQRLWSTPPFAGRNSEPPDERRQQ
jgi:hypothetical protein